MDDNERRLIEFECASNTVRFYRRLDAADGPAAASLFAEDGVWYRDGDDSGYTGRAEIADHVNKLRERGNPNIAPEDKIVVHLVTNIEVTVNGDDTAEVQAHTTIIAGAKSHTPGEMGTTSGISAVFPTVEIHKKTKDGWKIASKRTSRLMRVVK